MYISSISMHNPHMVAIILQDFYSRCKNKRYRLNIFWHQVPAAEGPSPCPWFIEGIPYHLRLNPKPPGPTEKKSLKACLGDQKVRKTWVVCYYFKVLLLFLGPISFLFFDTLHFNRYCIVLILHAVCHPEFLWWERKPYK